MSFWCLRIFLKTNEIFSRISALVLMNLIFRENAMVHQHVIKEWPAGKSSRISPRNSIQASRITSGLKETSAECKQASFRRSCLDKGCHSKGDWLIVAIVARELSSSKNRKKKLGNSKIKRNAINECKDRFQLIHGTPIKPQRNQNLPIHFAPTTWIIYLNLLAQKVFLELNHTI